MREFIKSIGYEKMQRDSSSSRHPMSILEVWPLTLISLPALSRQRDLIHEGLKMINNGGCFLKKPFAELDRLLSETMGQSPHIHAEVAFFLSCMPLLLQDSTGRVLGKS